MSMILTPPAEGLERSTACPPFPREHRRSPRRRASGHLTGVVCDPDDPTRPKRICAIRLTDISDTGLIGITSESLPIGAAIVLFTTPRGAESDLDFHGTVVRCQSSKAGYVIDVAFDERRAA